jgi:hypothetical protein
VTTSFQWKYTTFLNIAFIAVGGELCWLYRNRDRLGGGVGYAVDPVCGLATWSSRPRRTLYS